VVLQFFSPLTFPNIFDFAKKHNYDVELLYCWAPNYLSINAILPDHMEKFKIWAKKTAEENPTIKYLNILNGFLSQYTFDPKLHYQCQTYIDDLDSIRNNRLESIQKLFRPVDS
jgi:hypothetical protein